MRQSARRRARNVAKKHAIRTAEKKFRKALAAKKTDEARELLRALYTLIDKAAKTGVIHTNAAGRAKSRFARQVALLGAKR